MSVLFRWDHDRQEAVSVSTYGQNGTTVDTLTLHLSDSPIMQGFVARRRSIPIEDGQRDPRIPEPWRDRLRVRGLLCVPVWGTEEPLALLFLMELNKPRRWRPGEMELVESFVNRAAVALENAYLHKQLQWAAALEERQRIAAEMHDGLAQTLSYLNLKTFNATKLVEAGDLAAAMAEHNEMQTTIERATKDVRESIASLQGTPRPRRPLQEWLAETVDEFNSDGGPAAHLANEIEEPLFLPDNDSVQVLRVVQEALLNAGRHARAERITVWLRESGDSYALVIEDDGEGFDPKRPSIDNADHFGLSIMRARAARIGGRIRIDSARGQGTQVTLTWPRQAQGS
jgi:two-component system nitrate/nitrite sensor histidine kinase NarX